MTFLEIVITLVMLKFFSSCSQSHGFILHSKIPWLRLTIQKQEWDYSSFCPCQSCRVCCSSCRPQSRLQGMIVRWHYCPTNATKSQLLHYKKNVDALFNAEIRHNFLKDHDFWNWWLQSILLGNVEVVVKQWQDNFTFSLVPLHITISKSPLFVDPTEHSPTHTNYMHLSEKCFSTVYAWGIICN